ncbi:MAG: hypothetical protein Q4C13_03680 [Clostridia bacterium]|nr:hypothetical protein [Clostridia bacterium]
MNIRRLLGNTWKTLIWPIGIFAVFFAATRLSGSAGNFGSLNSLETIARQSILCTMMALAMSCNMINGRWDFSVGIITVISSFIAAPIVRELELGAFGLLAVCILAATLLCLVNGGLYLLMRVPSLVVSIGMLMIYETLALLVNNGGGARFTGMKNTIFGRSPAIFILGLVMFLIFYVIYSHTRFGYNVRSLGNNQLITNNIGVNERKNIVLCYVLCGVFSGVAGAINLSMKGSIEASSTFNNNMGMMFAAFPPVFIGLYLSLYTNFVFGVFVGAVSMKMLTAGILALGLPSAVQDIGIGLFLLLFIALTTNQARFLDWRMRVKRAALM